MAEFKPPASEQEYDENFKPLKPLMNPHQAYIESSRCLFCYDAPCIKACPTAIDIPLFIRQIHNGNLDGAAKTIYESNYLGSTCGTVCPVEVLCEGACVYTNAGAKPLEIGRLQTYASHQAMEAGKQLFSVADTNGKRVAVIGAGPAGLTCACELRLAGVEVDVYEAKSKASGLVAHGIAPYKITNEDSWAEADYLQKQFGFELFYNHPVQTKEMLEELEGKYDAIFLGVGLGATASLNLPGEELQHVWGAIDFIEMLRSKKHTFKMPAKVVVLGGGNTAMDVASEAARMGASEVVLVYRRSKEKMGAYSFEHDLAKLAGVKTVFNASPIEIIGNQSVSGVKFSLTEDSESIMPEPQANSTFLLNCDWVILATGQEKRTAFFRLIDGVSYDEQGKLIVNPDNFQTGNRRYFAAGDAVNGGLEVVNAVAEGKKAAQGMLQYLAINNTGA